LAAIAVVCIVGENDGGVGDVLVTSTTEPAAAGVSLHSNVGLCLETFYSYKIVNRTAFRSYIRLNSQGLDYILNQGILVT
jgi:hypothetical protein